MTQDELQARYERKLAEMGMSPTQEERAEGLSPRAVYFRRLCNGKLNWIGMVENIPGLVGDAARFTLASMPLRHPPFALAAGLLTAATAYGRHVHTNGLQPSIQVLASLPAGGGKDMTLKAPRRIINAGLTSAGLTYSFFMRGAHSASALVDELNDHPIKTLLMDESGDFFSIARSSNGNYLQTAKSALKEVYSVKMGDCFEGMKHARKNGQAQALIRVETPFLASALVIQDDIIGKAVQESDIQDGTIPRMLLFHSTDEPRMDYDIADNPPPMPEELTAHLAAWFKREDVFRWVPDPHAESGSNAVTINHRTDFNALNIRVEHAAVELLHAFGDEVQEAQRSSVKDGKLTAPIWSRAYENARKVAMLIACGRGYEHPEREAVTESDAKWAVQIVRQCVKDAESLLEGNICDDSFDALKAKILRLMSRSGKDGVTKTTLCRWKCGDRKQRDLALEDLADAELIKLRAADGKFVLTATGKRYAGK